MTDLKAKIEELVIQNLNNQDLFLVDVHVSGTGKKKITVWLDGDKGVSVEDCAEISRKLGNALEAGEMIDTAYVLEVSSAGIDQPLKLNRQYQKNVGRKLTVVLKDEQIKMGTLTAVDEGKIVLEEEVKDSAGKGKKVKLEMVEIPFDQIKKSNVLIAFN